MTTQKCQCANPDCKLTVKLPREVTRELTNSNWAMLARGCLGGIPVGYKLIRRNTTYAIYSPDIKSDIEAAIETAELVSDSELMEKLRQGIKDMDEGKFLHWEQVKRELGLE